MTIPLSKTYIIDNYYSFLDFRNLTLLFNEIDNLNANIKNLKTDPEYRVLHSVLNYRYENLLNRINHLIKQKRSKRGLINGLGSAISWLTGNMDANDKEKYDSILQKVEQNMYHIEHNEEARLSLNKQLTSEINKDIVILNYYKKQIKTTNHIIDISLRKLNHHDLLAILTLLNEKVRDIEDSINYCTKGLLHPSIINPNEFQNIYETQKQILSRDTELNWLIGRSTCSISDKGIIYYFIQLPLNTTGLMSYLNMPYPFIENNSTYVLHVDKTVVVKNKTDIYVPSHCIDYDQEYYCTKLEKVKDKCILELVSNFKLSNCKLLKTNIDPIFVFIKETGQYLTHKIKQVEVKTNNLAQMFHLYSTSLINLEKGETFTNYNNLPIVYKDNVNLPFLSEDIPAITITTNVTLQSLDTIKLTPINIEQLENYEITSDKTWLYML